MVVPNKFANFSNIIDFCTTSGTVVDVVVVDADGCGMVVVDPVGTVEEDEDDCSCGDRLMGASIVFLCQHTAPNQGKKVTP